MAAPISEWLPFDASQPKKRRAENVCLLCHSKKVKCDLQARSRTGHASCTNCEASRKECHPRTSRRTKRGHTITTFRVQPPQKPLTPETATPEIVIPPSDQRSSFSAGDIRTLLSPELQDLGNTPPARVDGALGPALSSTEPMASTSSLPAIGGAQHGISSLIHASPSQQSLYRTSPRADLVAESVKGDIDTGFLQIYGPENEIETQRETIAASFQIQRSPLPDQGQQDLMESFADTYLEYCYPFCPVLDPGSLFDEVARSPLLANALATAGSHVQPPLVPHSGPAEYYARARAIFYNDEEPDQLATLKAVSLFYWWAPKAVTTVHRHSSWWWTSVLIRHSQQMDLHRECGVKDPRLTDYTLSVRRRIWWTAFARERLTALCQSKPAIIDPADCNVRETSLADFPDDPVFQRKGEVFIYWVRLCAIMGRLAKTLYRPENDDSRLIASTEHVQELSDWINALPPHLQLPIRSARTQRFDRDIHQLHLPYLTTVILIHLKRSPHALPQALPPAILAAYCISRILRDVLARGNSRFLMAITCWYTGTAFIPLLQASHIPHLAKDANECLDVLERTAEQLQTMWASANLIVGGFRRLRRTAREAAARSVLEREPPPPQPPPPPPPPTHHHQQQQQPTAAQQGREGSSTTSHSTPVMVNMAGGGGGGGGGRVGGDGFDWLTLFPFVTHETGSIVASLLNDRDQGVVTRVFPSPENTLYHEALMTQLDDMFAVDGFDFMTTS